jgi:hypothetical protein
MMKNYLPQVDTYDYFPTQIEELINNKSGYTNDVTLTNVVKETYLEYLKILKKIVTTNFIKYEKY